MRITLSNNDVRALTTAAREVAEAERLLAEKRAEHAAVMRDAGLDPQVNYTREADGSLVAERDTVGPVPEESPEPEGLG